MSFDLTCNRPNKCKYEVVNTFTIAFYTLTFPDDNIVVQGVAGQFATEIYNHLDCKQNV
jgi:hypothetical protein